MRKKTSTKIYRSQVEGPVVGDDMYNINLIMFKDEEREFVVTHNADIKPVSYFTGRETELQDLRQRIEEGRKSVLVSGMGGIGKTHICRKLFEEYLNKHADNQGNSFRHIGYIEYNVDIDSSLLSCLKYKEQDKAEDNLEAAWKELEYLASDGRLLLFVDNVNVSMGDDPGLKRLMSIPGAIVLTSRRRVFSKEFEPYRIGFLNAEKCREIYEKIRFEDSGKRIERDEEPDLEYIINTLAARHTITVEFLAHLAWTKNWTVKKLRKELEDNGFQLEYRNEEDKLVNIQKSYETLYDLSILTAAEQNILEAFSMFPYIPLDVETCNLWLLEDAEVSEDDDILNMLYRKGWMQYDVEQNGYSMHPVFAQFIYDKCKPKLKEHTGLICACNKKMVCLIGDLVPECRKYIVFANHIIKNIDMKKTEKAVLIANLAELLIYVGEYQEAEKYYLASIDNCGKCSENSSYYIKNIYIGLARAYLKQGKLTEAEKVLYKVLQIEQTLLEDRECISVSTLNDVAYLKFQQGQYEEAEKWYKMILMVADTVSEKNSIDIASVYNNLSQVYQKVGKFEKAEELIIKGLKIRKEKLGENHPDTANSYNDLAVLCANKGEYARAEELIKKSIEICERVFGESHPNTILVYENLASVYKRCKKSEEEEKIYRKILRVGKDITTEEEASIYYKLADLYMNMEQYQKAEEAFGICIDICKKGQETGCDGIIGASYNNLAMIYRRQGKNEKAEDMYKKNIMLTKNIYGVNHLNTAICYNNLAILYLLQEEYQKAITYSLRAFRIMVTKECKNENVAVFYETMAKAYSRLNPNGNFNEWLRENMKE